MRKTAFIVLTVLLVSVVAPFKSGMSADLSLSVDRHMKRVIQLTFEGDNGEAYFSPDGRKLIYQSNRGGKPCDVLSHASVSDGR